MQTVNIERVTRALKDVPEVGHIEVTRSGATDIVLLVRPSQEFRAPAFGLFFFSDQEAEQSNDSYALVLDASRKADELGLDSIWTPERHFTGVGAASPSPSVLSAALATITSRIGLRAGSVVLPLHHPVKVAEEWAMVDRLSNGRAGVSFASGWVPDDFVLAPENYAERRALLSEYVTQIQELWAGNALPFRNGLGQTASVRIRPRPVQSRIPVWLTAAASPGTFELAGKLGANVLTALLQMPVEQLADNIRLYRSARAAAGFPPEGGKVTVMLHTYLAADEEEAKREAWPALRAYFAAQTALRHTVASDAGRAVGKNPHISDRFLDRSVDKFMAERCLIGSPETVQPLLEKLVAIGSDEIACLVDFGLATDKVLNGVADIAELKRRTYRPLEEKLNSLVNDAGGVGCRVEIARCTS